MSLFSEFCAGFGVAVEDAVRVGRAWYQVLPAHKDLVERHASSLFAAGLYLGEEHRSFAASPALVDLIAARTGKFKAVVDEKAEWLFLCGRDVFAKGVTLMGQPTPHGFVLVQNGRGENLGLGKAEKRGNVAIRNVLDKGFFLRRER